MLASYLKNLPTKPTLEDDPLDSNWPFNYDRRVSFENLEYLYSKFLHHRRVSLSIYKSMLEEWNLDVKSNIWHYKI